MTKKTLYTNGTVVTLDDKNSIRVADLLVVDGRIAEIGEGLAGDGSLDAENVDCSGRLILPGFIQTHIHLNQAIFRGLAEETDLLTWLSRKIWPLEAAHDSDSLTASTELGLSELIRTGTTTVCDMGSVQESEVVAEVVQRSGIRAVVSKLLMDSQEGAPASLLQSPDQGMEQLESLYQRFHGSANGRLRVAAAPRFVLSCSHELLSRVSEWSLENDAIIHTHINESRGEIETTEAKLGKSAVAYFDELALLHKRFIAAHGVWFSDEERKIYAANGARLTHCPTANLKLASGVADIRAHKAAGITVGLGADGMPCNNRSDIFEEMRLAGLISRNLRGEEALTSEEIVRLATSEGARVLGLEDEIGTLEKGKRADLVVLDATGIAGSLLWQTNVYDALVYQYSSAQVDSAVVDGEILYKDGKLLTLNENVIVQSSRAEREKLIARSGI